MNSIVASSLMAVVLAAGVPVHAPEMGAPNSPVHSGCSRCDGTQGVNSRYFALTPDGAQACRDYANWLAMTGHTITSSCSASRGRIVVYYV